ncbi:MAG: carboxylesterase/lipase family protein [Gordonia sp. (in: high G+C Gram-positive bacteria)]
MALIDTLVATADGTVAGRRGVRTRRGTIGWYGIPFAAPPVDGRRFAAPQPVQPWRGVRPATRFGFAAIQDKLLTATGPGRFQPVSEDCLTLNVFSPDEESAQPRPVMVFIHGGAYLLGTTATPLYDGTRLARAQNVVVVTVQYRFGPFGMLDFSAYSTPDRQFDENPGLADHLAALRWVQRNIAEFGGDPDNVTVFGESAGGSSVVSLLATPSAQGLFRRAIAESPAADLVIAKETAAIYADEFLRILADPARRTTDPARGEPIPATEAQRLLAGATAAELHQAGRRLMRFAAKSGLREPLPFAPVSGSELLPQTPIEAARAGRTLPVPLIIGTNRDEGLLFTKIKRVLSLPTAERILLQVQDAAVRDEVLGLYAGGDAELVRLDGDSIFWAPVISFADAHRKVAPTYVYRYDFASRALRGSGLGATHGTELFAVFDGYRMPVFTPLAAGDWRATRRVTRAVQSRWGAFARTGVPGGLPDVPGGWPAYEDPTRAVLVIDRRCRVEADPDTDRRLAWERGRAAAFAGSRED